jgi:hypothetical protein
VNRDLHVDPGIADDAAGGSFTIIGQRCAGGCRRRYRRPAAMAAGAAARAALRASSAAPGRFRAIASPWSVGRWLGAQTITSSRQFEPLSVICLRRPVVVWVGRHGGATRRTSACVATGERLPHAFSGDSGRRRCRDGCRRGGHRCAERGGPDRRCRDDRGDRCGDAPDGRE